MKYYIIDGRSYSWDYVHNTLGYSEWETEPFQYKSAESETWGDYAVSGYGDPHGDMYDYASYDYFANGKTGWLSLNELAANGLYPADCNDGPELTNGSVISPTATYEWDGENYYLIRDDVEIGWIEESQLSEYGWEIPDNTQYEFILVDSTTGKVTYGVETLNEMAFTETGYFTIDGGDDVVFVEQSPYPIVCALLQLFVPTESVADGGSLDTDEGAHYYASKLYIPIVYAGNAPMFYGWDVSESSDHNVKITNGTGATQSVSAAILAFIDSANAEVVTVVDGNNSFYKAFKYTLSGTDYYYVVDGEHEAWTDDLSGIGYSDPWPIVRSRSGTQTAASVASDASFDTGMEWDASKLYIGETNDGQGNVTRYGWEAEEGTPAPAFIDVFFYYNADATSVKFSPNDYWGSRVIDDNDKSILQTFGVSVAGYDATGNYVIARDGNAAFTFTPVGLYSGLRTGDLNAEMRNFYCGLQGNNPGSMYYGICIKNYSAYSTSTLTWKCRITRNS